MKRLIPILLLLVGSFAHAEAEDVLGWSDTYWGMTIEDAVKVTRGTKSAGKATVTIPNFVLFGRQFDVTLSFFCSEDCASSFLHRVFLNFETGGVGVQNAASHNVGDLERQLLKALHEKYGKSVTLENTDDDPSNDWQMWGKILRLEWEFPSTIVEYWRYNTGWRSGYLNKGDPPANLTVITIDYTRNTEEAEKNKL